MKIIVLTLLMVFVILQPLDAHDASQADGFKPNRPFLECKKQHSEEKCISEFPVTYRQIIPDKYLVVEIASETEMCFNLSRLMDKQKKVVLHTIIGNTSLYVFRPDNMSPEDHQSLKKSIDVHIHRTEQTEMCSNGHGFLVNVGRDFVDVWKAAEEGDRYPFFGRDIWVTYKRGDWKEPYQFWK